MNRRPDLPDGASLIELHRLPMFPLGSVLFPGLGLPLRVFEPRYRAMIADCLDGDRSFGVVLIERGSEVGGGEVRLRVATVAKILDVSLQDDGTLGVLAVGTGRVEVLEWLPDAPYPAAIVTPLDDRPERPGSDTDDGAATRERHPSSADVASGEPPSGDGRGSRAELNDEAIARIVRRLRFSLAQRAEANLAAAPATIELSPDPSVALWQVCALVPATPFDDYGLLATVSIRERIGAIEELLDASAEEVRFHLS